MSKTTVIILLVTIPVAVIAIFLLWINKPAAKAFTVPENAQPGDLSPFEPCEHQPGKKKMAAECATLTVPENWNDPNSPLIALPVLRFVSKSSNPKEPVFILLGGPGASNLATYPKEWLLETHDVILVGYRGVDGSVVLDCPEISRVSSEYMGSGFFTDQFYTDLSAAVDHCAEDLQVEGIDLRGYTAEGVLRDLEAVRQALGYERINLWSESYGTRLAQLYAYTNPDALNRVVMMGMNTPGHFVYDPAVFDELIQHLSDLCAKDVDCKSQTSNLAQTMFTINHDMPKRWLFLPIDSGTIRFLTQMMFFDTPQISMVTDAYIAAANGDPSGLAMLNFIAPFAFPWDMFHMGDFINKGGSLDLEYYQGLESIQLGESILGAPMAEWIWPMAAKWPVELVSADLRHLQETNVDMLVINGTLDFSTPPNALKEYEGYYHNVQTVLLPEYSHVSDLITLQPEATRLLITSYYDTGIGDTSLFTYQAVNFKPKMSTTLMAKLAIGVIVLLPPLLIWLLVRIIRRKSTNSKNNKQNHLKVVS